MSFKKIVSIFLTAALLVSMLPVFGSAEDTEIFKVGVEAVPSASTVSDSPIVYNQGEEITVNIRASQNTGITSIKLLVDYDETVLEPVEGKYSATKLFNEYDSLTAKTTSKGDGYFIFYSDSYPNVNTATGIIAQISFKVKDVCATDVAVSVKPFSEGSCVKNTATGMVVVPFALEADTFAVHKINKEAGVVTAPTCTDDGYTTYTCEGCKATVVANTVEKLGHAPKAAVEENRKEATCTEDGSYDSVVYCATCGEELSRETVVLNKLGHAPKAAVEENRKEATCTEDGYYDSVVYCATCNEELSRETIVLPKLGHDPKPAVEENRVEPTCTTDGSYEMVIYCATCNAELSRETTVLPKLGHKAEPAVQENRVEPTCTTDGSYDLVVYCETCDAELFRETIVLTKLGHTPKAAVQENRVEATCTTDGSYDLVVYCAVCNAEISRETIVLTKLGHTPKAAVEENRVEATCTKDGAYDLVVYCATCNVELSRETIVIPMLPHDLVAHEAQEATHTQIGWEAYYTCADCDYTTYVEIPMVPYKPGDLNGDELITDADAIYLLYATFDAEKYPLNQDADYNGDGDVTDADAVYLLYAIFDSENYPLRKN